MHYTREDHYIHASDRRFVAVATDAETAELIVQALNKLSSPAQNRWNSHEESDTRKASGECAGEDLLLRLTAKIARGEGLTMSERLQRQGLIFNHAGRCDGPIVTNLRHQ